MMNFAQAFSRQSICEQADDPMVNGAFVTYDHFLQLIKVWNLKKRKQFLEQVRAEGAHRHKAQAGDRRGFRSRRMIFPEHANLLSMSRTRSGPTASNRPELEHYCGDGKE